MNASFAVEVLSSTVANVPSNYYGEETHGTAKLSEYMDKFLDCLNTRNQIEGVKNVSHFFSHTLI